MQISGININGNMSKTQPVSFKAMKKADFRGIDFAVVEKFKAPIEKFDVIADFQNWAGNLVEKIKNTNFLGRQAETIAQRKGMLKDWFNYVIEENGAYTKAIQLLILSAITKNLGKKDDNLPPTLNKGVLADCVSDLNKELEKDKKVQFDFNKMYQNKLRAFYSEDTKTGESGTKWVVIPSKEHDPENFEANVEKLKSLSHKVWCTKSFNAEPYLRDGDFRVFLENGEPKIGIRFVGNKIQEIQGEKNDSIIPLDYLETVEKQIKNENLFLNYNAKNEISRTKELKNTIDEIKENLSDAIKNKDAKTIFNYFGITTEVTPNKQLIISEYHQPSSTISYESLGIDENFLIENVSKILGNANFVDSNIKSLTNLEEIGGNVDFKNSNITNLGKLTSIGGNVDFSLSNIKDTGDLISIGGYTNFSNSNIEKIIKLKEIGRWACFINSKILDLSSLEIIKGNLNLNNSKVEHLGKLKNILGDVYLGKSNIKTKDFSNINVKGKFFF